MAANETASQDIFEGAERVEILGKLPGLLWGYIGALNRFLDDLQNSPDSCSGPGQSLSKSLDILAAAADFLGNKELKTRLDDHQAKLTAWANGEISNEDLAHYGAGEVEKLQSMAGPRPESGLDEIMSGQNFEREMAKLEHIKTGRSADIVVSVELLDEIRDYLSKDVLTEGISSMLVIDNAGTLIVSVGNKISVDAVALAAVAAANFAATEKIAHLIGETDFVLLFYKGHNESFHFRRVGKEYIVVTIFNNAMSLGLLRLKLSEVAKTLVEKLPKRED
jgi:predicted regulator of Ras-like GTPase activity (Roadblock/LC7/MglB family)